MAAASETNRRKSNSRADSEGGVLYNRADLGCVYGFCRSAGRVRGRKVATFFQRSR